MKNKEAYYLCFIKGNKCVVVPERSYKYIYIYERILKKILSFSERTKRERKMCHRNVVAFHSKTKQSSKKQRK